MNAKQITILVVAILFLSVANLFFVGYFFMQKDQLDSLHDQLLISESKLEQLQADHKVLLEKVNAHPDFQPYVLPTGKVGDK